MVKEVKLKDISIFACASCLMVPCISRQEMNGSLSRIHQKDKVATIRNKAFRMGDENPPVNSLWWSGEIRIPFEKLPPFVPGRTLRLAFR